MADRTIHAHYPGMDIVRYDRAGKWYLEPTNKSLPRQHIDVREAARQAVWEPAGTSLYLGLPGGQRFDQLVRQAQAKADAA